MSIKDILVHLDVSEKGAYAPEFATSLASELGAHLTAAGVVVEITPPASFMGEFPYDLMVEAADQAREAAKAAYEKMKQAAPAALGTELVMIQAVAGQAREEFGRLARHFDLTVVGQGGPDSGADDELMAEGALFRSGRPVFIVPYIHRGPAKLGKAIVAYKLGRSSLGASLTVSHTGAIAGEDAAYDAFFKAHGIVRVDLLETLDRKSTRLNSSHIPLSRMPSSA